MSINKLTILNRVNSGVSFLNDKGVKWAEEASTNGNINWLNMFKEVQYHDHDQFDINDPDKCVLGLFIKWTGHPLETFYQMRINLGLTYEECTELGFYGEFDDYDLDHVIEYTEVLQETWINMIDTLLAVDTAIVP